MRKCLLQDNMSLDGVPLSARKESQWVLYVIVHRTDCFACDLPVCIAVPRIFGICVRFYWTANVEVMFSCGCSSSNLSSQPNDGYETRAVQTTTQPYLKWYSASKTPDRCSTEALRMAWARHSSNRGKRLCPNPYPTHNLHDPPQSKPLMFITLRLLPFQDVWQYSFTSEWSRET